jgi:hypothetical protein
MEEFDARWHSGIDRKVASLMEDVKGNGEKGLKERVNNIERYVDDSIEREKERARRAEDEAKDRRSTRTMYGVAAFGAVLALMGLLVMAILDHTLWKPAPQIVQQTVTTTDSTTSSKTTGR